MARLLCAARLRVRRDGSWLRVVLPSGRALCYPAAKIDDKGVLRLKGHFDTTPKQVKYQLGFIPSDGAWKLSGISIDIE